MKRKLFRIITPVLAIILTLFFFEFLIRILEHNKKIAIHVIRQPGSSIGMYRYDEDLGWKTTPNYRAEIQHVHRSSSQRINRDGWRDREYPLQKDPDVYRIAVIGGSMTYGFAVDAEETYPEILENLLNDKVPGKYEVINFGVCGYGLSQIMLNYEKNVRRYKPDLVLIMYAKHNIGRVLFTEIWGTQKPTFVYQDDRLKLLNHPVQEDKLRPLKTKLMEISTLYRFIHGKLSVISIKSKGKQYEDMDSNSELLTTVRQMFRHLKKVTNQDNARLIAITYGDDTKWIEELSRKAEVEVFTIEDYAQKADWEAKGILSNPQPDGHWSPLGHDFVANALNNYLEMKKVIADPVIKENN